MARAWYHYTQWEDWAVGMYALPVSEVAVERAVALLSDADATRDAMAKVVESWPISARYRLSATDTNRRSWLGQAACCLTVRATQKETCIAWSRLSDTARARANRMADAIITEWEEREHGQTLLAG